MAKSSDNLGLPKEADRKLIRLIDDPTIQSFYQRVRQIVSFDLPESSQGVFRKTHSWLTAEPPTPRVAYLKNPQPNKTNWYSRMVEGFLNHTQESFACAWYHASNLAKLEERIIEIGNDPDPNLKKLLAECHATIGNSNTRQLDFEFQACLLAQRRCLDHFTRAVAAYFGQEFHSFRRIQKRLKGLEA